MRVKQVAMEGLRHPILLGLLATLACSGDESRSMTIVSPSDARDSSSQAACFENDDGGAWTAITAVDMPSCDGRKLKACPSNEGTPADTVAADLLRLAIDRCQLPSYVYLEVGFVAGCPSRIRLRDGIGRPVSVELVSCLFGALRTERWECATDVSCALVEHDTLP
jgi:hypothetical protein